jgi:hypothetical protein
MGCCIWYLELVETHILGDGASCVCSTLLPIGCWPMDWSCTFYVDHVHTALTTLFSIISMPFWVNRLDQICAILWTYIGCRPIVVEGAPLKVEDIVVVFPLVGGSIAQLYLRWWVIFPWQPHSNSMWCHLWQGLKVSAYLLFCIDFFGQNHLLFSSIAITLLSLMCVGRCFTGCMTLRLALAMNIPQKKAKLLEWDCLNHQFELLLICYNSFSCFATHIFSQTLLSISLSSQGMKCTSTKTP